MKNYIKPEVQVYTVDTKETIMIVSNNDTQVGIEGSYKDDFSSGRRGSSWEDYEN